MNDRKKEQQTKKLRLRRQTLRTLTPEQLRIVVGGDTTWDPNCYEAGSL